MRYLKYLTVFPNLGKYDRLIRGFASITAFIIFVGSDKSNLLSYILLVASIILLLTSIVSFCPIYSLLGLKTNKEKQVP